MITKHSYVSFIRHFKKFATHQMNNSKGYFEIGSFAISVNKMAVDLVKLAHHENLAEVDSLEQELFLCGRDFVKKFSADKHLKYKDEGKDKYRLNNVITESLPNRYNLTLNLERSLYR